MSKQPLILLVGPTASGKTELSLRLARRLKGEIVSADSRLFYRGMNIGTAKPSPAERALVPHHLIDVANPDETWSLAVFQQAAREAIAGIQNRKHLPFLVGGTGQFIRALTEGWTPPTVQPNENLRRALEKMKDEMGGYWLHEKLSLLDPQAAQKIDPRNERRTIRALEVILSTGQTFSAQRNRSDLPFDLITIGLKRPRVELYQRIDERIETMFATGFLEEVRKLLEQGYSPNLPTMSAIGYREAVMVLRGEMSEEEAKQHMRRLTRIFVRRQANWFKESDPSITWFEAGAKMVAEAIETYLRARIAETSSD